MLSGQPTIPQLLQMQNIAPQADNKILAMKEGEFRYISFSLHCSTLIHVDSGVTPLAKPVKVAAPKKKKASPTKSLQPKPKKTTSKASSKKQNSKSASSSSESDSSDDSELDIEMPEEPSPIPAVRPQDPEAAAGYDTLKAVWSPRNRRPAVDTIKAALVAFKDVVKSVRDTWKEQSQAMKVAENQSESDKAAELKKSVTLQRRLMEVVVNTTLEKGHPIIVEKYVHYDFFPTALAYYHRFHGCRCSEQNESYYHVNLLAQILSLLLRMGIDNGCCLRIYGLHMACALDGYGANSKSLVNLSIPLKCRPGTQAEKSCAMVMEYSQMPQHNGPENIYLNDEFAFSVAFYGLLIEKVFLTGYPD